MASPASQGADLDTLGRVVDRVRTNIKRVIEGKSQFGAIRLQPIVLSNFDPAASEVVHG